MELMLDLETLGKNAPEMAIVSIGAVTFDWNRTDAVFSASLDLSEQQVHGRTIDESTVRWWLRQSEEAQSAFMNPVPVMQALEEFAFFCKSQNVTAVWGNGASFDCIGLESLYEDFAMPCPFAYWQHRCYRTLKNLRPDIKRTTKVTHLAFDDAMRQAIHAIEIGRALGIQGEEL